MQPLARTERTALADSLDAAGPTAPTLCEGWSTRDLAAHVVVRERRLDSALGAVVPPLAAYGDRVRRRYAARPFATLVARVRSGPPRLSPFAIPAVDRAANGVELFVHHEDVRRGRDGWHPRDLPAGAQDELWGRLRKGARLAMRNAPCGVVLRRPDGAAVTAREGDPTVTVTGPASELTLFALGRQEHAVVDVDGDPALAERVRATSFGV